MIDQSIKNNVKQILIDGPSNGTYVSTGDRY